MKGYANSQSFALTTGKIQNFLQQQKLLTKTFFQDENFDNAVFLDKVCLFIKNHPCEYKTKFFLLNHTYPNRTWNINSIYKKLLKYELISDNLTLDLLNDTALSYPAFFELILLSKFKSQNANLDKIFYFQHSEIYDTKFCYQTRQQTPDGAFSYKNVSQGIDVKLGSLENSTSSPLFHVPILNDIPAYILNNNIDVNKYINNKIKEIIFLQSSIKEPIPTSNKILELLRSNESYETKLITLNTLNFELLCELEKVQCKMLFNPEWTVVTDNLQTPLEISNKKAFENFQLDARTFLKNQKSIQNGLANFIYAESTEHIETILRARANKIWAPSYIDDLQRLNQLHS